MADEDTKVLCLTPTPGKQGTRIPAWKYEAVRAAIHQAVPDDDAGIEFRNLPGLVEKALSPDVRRRLGSVPWHATTVKLHLEVLGEVERIPGSKPQRIRRVAADRPGGQPRFPQQGETR